MVKKFWSYLAISFACGVLTGGAFTLSNWLLVAPRGLGKAGGMALLMWIETILLVTLFPALLALPATLGMLLFRRWRGKGASYFIAAAVFLMVALPLARLAVEVRHGAFKDLAIRSAPLVKAIQDHERRRGRPPEKLEALVPEFLPAIPRTGMSGYPEYKYWTGASAGWWEGNPWILCVSTSCGPLNWDRFLYFPLQNYPDPNDRGKVDRYSGWFERMGDWAYFHE
ncbi:MAG: hypothetical protein HY717_04970 [Planctomycetes bacterium]|nr:hypothetical protein [Planctomycetota bacterium]